MWIEWSKKGGNGWAGGKCFCTVVCAELLWLTIYCSKTSTNTGYQSGSWSLRGLWRQDLRIMKEYDLTTAIAIRPLTQLRTCEMGSLSFSVMSRLKVVNMMRDLLMSMTSNERKNGKNISVDHGSSYRVYLSSIYPTYLGYFTLVPSCRCLHL